MVHLLVLLLLLLLLLLARIAWTLPMHMTTANMGQQAASLK